MKKLLIDTLEPFGYPIFLQGSLNKDVAYPDSFFTFWNNETNDNSAYDNQPNNYVWDFDLNFYSNDPEIVNSILPKAIKALKDVGAVIGGVGYDVLSDEITHTGRGVNVKFIE